MGLHVELHAITSKDQIIKNQIRRSPSSFCQSLTELACLQCNNTYAGTFFSNILFTKKLRQRMAGKCSGNKVL